MTWPKSSASPEYAPPMTAAAASPVSANGHLAHAQRSRRPIARVYDSCTGVGLLACGTTSSSVDGGTTGCAGAEPGADASDAGAASSSTTDSANSSDNLAESLSPTVCSSALSSGDAGASDCACTSRA